MVNGMLNDRKTFSVVVSARIELASGNALWACGDGMGNVCDSEVHVTRQTWVAATGFRGV